MRSYALTNDSLRGPEHRPLERAFCTGLVVMLLGYAFLGKGFAYLHFPVGFPLYVGEIVLLLGGVWAFSREGLRVSIFRATPVKLYLCFVLWGLVRTVPYFDEHGAVAARDAALYGYGAYMILVCGLMRDRGQLERVAVWYAKPAAAYVYWVPLWYLIFFFAGSVLPNTPGTDTPLFTFKGHVVGAHVAAVVSFFLLLAGEIPQTRLKNRSIAWYAVAMFSVIIIMSRGVYLLVACALGTALALSMRRAKFAKLLLAVALALTIFLVAVSGYSFGETREASPEVLVGLAQSIVTETDDPRFREGTKTWRLMWWAVIVDETLLGPHFWAGRGFGENLADVHGFQVSAEGDPHQLRSPHNAHMTVLARMGVPGFLLWILLHASLVRCFYRGWRRARQCRNRLLQGVLAWTVCYWVACMVSSSFDVILESPHGAIWFWSVMGIGLAASTMTVDPSPTRAAETERGRARTWKA